MNRIFRLSPRVLVFVAAFGLAACDQQGCGPQAEEAVKKAPEIVCGVGTTLQAGQCIATETVTTR